MNSLPVIIVAIGAFVVLVMLMARASSRHAADDDKHQGERVDPPPLPDQITFNSNLGTPADSRFVYVYWRATGGLGGRLRRLAQRLHLK